MKSTPLSNAPYPWQQVQWKRLNALRHAERIPHALLLNGPIGAGIDAFANEFVATLLCSSPNQERRCGACKSCHLYASGNHPDLNCIGPGEVGKAIKVDQIRALGEFVGLKSHYGGYKCAIVEAAEQMNINAANSLLKTLEEPPENTLILLLCERQAGLPLTVRSRCQVVDMRVPSETARTWLDQQLDGEQDPMTLLCLSDNAPLAALELADSEGHNERLTLVRDLAQLMTHHADPVSVAEKWSKYDSQRIFRWLVTLFEDMVRIKMVERPSRLLHPDIVDDLRGIAKQVDLDRLIQARDRMVAVRRLIEGRSNVNVQTLLEAFTIQWA